MTPRARSLRTVVRWSLAPALVLLGLAIGYGLPLTY